MRKLMYLMIGLFILSCSTEQTDFETADVKANIPNSSHLWYDDGNLYIDKLAKFNKEILKVNAERKGNGKPQRSVYLKPAPKASASRVGGRTLAEPIEYTGALDYDDFIDWDNDGVNDEVVMTQRCYFPRTFVDVTVNGTSVSSSVSFYAKILGFKDVDGDGFKDIIFEGGNPQAYNNGEAYSPINVGLNVAGETYNLKDVVQSLVISTVDTNPEYVKWDLSAYGINNFTFHVFLFDESLTDGYGYQQTVTYGEFGFYSLNRLITGHTYILRFTNLGDDCSDIDVRFTI